jgi:hypothetical protein
MLKGLHGDHMDCYFDFIHFVNFDHAEWVVDTVMSKYDMMNLLLIKKKLKEYGKRVTTKAGKESRPDHMVIDSAYVLRILLEFYRI